MADPRGDNRFPFVLLFIFMAIAALVGGVVARMLPLGSPSDSAAPRVLAGPAEDSLAPLVKKTAPAVAVRAMGRHHGQRVEVPGLSRARDRLAGSRFGR